MYILHSLVCLCTIRIMIITMIITIIKLVSEDDTHAARCDPSVVWENLSTNLLLMISVLAPPSAVAAASIVLRENVEWDRQRDGQKNRLRRYDVRAGLFVRVAARSFRTIITLMTLMILITVTHDSRVRERRRKNANRTSAWTCRRRSSSLERQGTSCGGAKRVPSWATRRRRIPERTSRGTFARRHGPLPSRDYDLPGFERVLISLFCFFPLSIMVFVFSPFPATSRPAHERPARSLASLVHTRCDTTRRGRIELGTQSYRRVRSNTRKK